MIGAILARLLLRQRLDRVGWIGVTVTAVGATLIAVDAGGSDNGVHARRIAVALAAAAAVALEGIVATRAMVGLDTNTVMAVHEVVVRDHVRPRPARGPGRDRHSGQRHGNAGLLVPIVCAGMIAAYSYVVWYRSIRKIGVARAMALNISYAMWGAVFAWSLPMLP